MAEKVLSLPLYNGMMREDVETVTIALDGFFI
jgi:hypothetical protein